MLLGAAKYLAEQGSFDGTVYFIFQPDEENCFGAKTIDMVGFDGHRKMKEDKHGFDQKKDTPEYYDMTKYEEAAVVFWDYITTHFSTDVNNLSESSQYNVYNGIKTHVVNEVEE